MNNEFLNYNESSFWEKLKFSLKSWRNIGVGKSLLIWFLAISFIPLASLSFINYLNAYQGIQIVTNKALNSSSKLRLKYINTYFDGAIDFLKITAASHARLSIFETLNIKYTESKLPLNEFVKTKYWQSETNNLRNEFDILLKENDYYNFLFIDDSGNVIFSIKNETILGQNIFSGNQRLSILSKTARKSLETGKMIFSDLDHFEPSYDIISGFFIKPAINESGQTIGLLVLQISIDGLNQMIQHEADYGETGKAFLIGEDLILRTSTRFGDKSDVLKKKISNRKTNQWKDYLLHKDDLEYLMTNDLLNNKVLNYDDDGDGEFVMGIYRSIDELEPLGVNWALIEEIDHEEAFVYVRRLSDIAKISFALTLLIVFFISILVTRWFVNPIKQLSSWGKEVKIGKLSTRNIKAPDNEIGDMRNTFSALVTALTSYANVARMIAKGDYSKNVEIRSDDDILGISLNQMIISLKQVINQADKIANGDYSTIVKPRSENDSLGKSLFTMTETLRNNAIKIEQQDWHKSGLNQLESTIKRNSNIEELTNDIINYFCSYLDAQIGLLYLFEDDKLHLKSSYAIKDSDRVKLRILSPGEGVIGQSYTNKKTIIISDNNNSLPLFNYGVGEQQLNHFIIIPFISNNNVIGVMELGLSNKLSKSKLNFLEAASNDIALSIITLQSHIKVIELLEHTQEQAKELEVQQEELRQTNEELQEQTNALKISEENLQTQKEELKVTNEELEERSNILEIQTNAIKAKNKELIIARKDIETKAKDLELASRYKSEFLANMSHELRTPLNSIIVLSQLMAENKKGHLDDKEIQFSDTINSSGNDLLNLINDILDLSKVESGNIELNLERLYFDDFGTFIRSSFEEMMSEKNLSLTIKIKKGTPESIVSDIQRVKQIVKNLFSNAIKFTKTGGISMIIGKPEEGTTFNNPKLNTNNTIAISIVDTGIGIPKEKKGIIFEAFKQADGTTSRKYGGTGLGLSISKDFSKLLGGEMQLESKQGAGSTFTLFLPYKLKLNTDEKGIPDEYIALEADSNYTETKTTNTVIKTFTTKEDTSEVLINKNIIDDINNINKDDRVILIIEDDYNFASVLLNLAHEHTFKAIIAMDGESGLHLADYHSPNAILLDVGLPGMDGYEVMKRLKQNHKTRHIPVHFISANDSNIKAFKMGAIGYLTKPVEKKQLDNVFDKIESLISKPIKKLLIVEDEAIMRKSIINLMKSENIIITDVETGKEAYDKISTGDYDCMILDLGLEDMTGFELLDMLEKNQKATNLPIIIYTGSELTHEENDKLRNYSKSIILKGARSFERLLAETTLFLHQVESKLPEDKKKMLEKIHSKEDVIEGKTILVVDDDMRNVFAISSLLESYKANIVVGKNGLDGINKLHENNNIDLILMDIMMPEMDGYKAMRNIRKEKKYQKLPIIALTAKAMKEDREKCITAGANEYLSKPVDKDKLLSLLRVWLY